MIGDIILDILKKRSKEPDYDGYSCQLTDEERHNYNKLLEIIFDSDGMTFEEKFQYADFILARLKTPVRIKPPFKCSPQMVMESELKYDALNNKDFNKARWYFQCMYNF